MECLKDYTVIYSQPSIEALENLINEFLLTFDIDLTVDDMFFYGVFCKPQNYANYEFDITKDYGFNIPKILTSACSKESERIDFVKHQIKRIMQKEINKPEWMDFVEMNMDCNEYGLAPSTFLYIEPKDEKYTMLAQKLIAFLYSPNLTITMVKA